MSHFYSGCEGGKGEASRCGHKTTGIKAYAQSNYCGIHIHGWYDDETGINHWRVIVDGGRYGTYDAGTPLRIEQDDDQLRLIHDIENARKCNSDHVTVEHNVSCTQAEFKFVGQLNDNRDEVPF